MEYLMLIYADESKEIDNSTPEFAGLLAAYRIAIEKNSNESERQFLQSRIDSREK